MESECYGSIGQVSGRNYSTPSRVQSVMYIIYGAPIGPSPPYTDWRVGEMVEAGSLFIFSSLSDSALSGGSVSGKALTEEGFSSGKSTAVGSRHRTSQPEIR